MKKYFYFVSGFLLILILPNFSLLKYLLSMANGQIGIVWNARPINKVLADPAVSDTVKTKLMLINEIKKFGVEELGLKNSKNYSTYFEQSGKPVLWVLTASEKYKLKAYEWKFPFLGSVPYKGFFDKVSADKEELKIKHEGFDTDVGTTGGWSTLGWFRDPVLSGMLRQSIGGLANLILHEMTHGTLYVTDSTDFDENLASFVGESGAKLFLEKKFGKNSPELTKFVREIENENAFNLEMLKGAKKLDSLYSSFHQSMNDSVKSNMKQQMISTIFSELDTNLIHLRKRPKSLSVEEMPNNTFFLNFIRYDARKNIFETECREKFNSDLPAYILYLKKKWKGGRVQGTGASSV